MKKIVISIMLIMAIVMLSGCGEAEEEPSTTKQTEIEETVETVPIETSETEASVEENPTTEENTVDEDLLPDVHNIGGEPVCLNVPHWKDLDYGVTHAFVCIEDGDEFVSVTAHSFAEASTLEEAHKVAFEEFVLNIDNQTEVHELDNVTFTNETINGIDVYKYEGTFKSARLINDPSGDVDCYIIGYSFIFDCIPFTINGVLDDEEQNPDQIAELKKIVEAMMLTVRYQ